MTDLDRLDALAGGEDILASLSDDDVMYDHPVSMTGEPMDPVLFVRWDAVAAAVRDLDELRKAAQCRVCADFHKLDHPDKPKYAAVLPSG